MNRRHLLKTGAGGLAAWLSTSILPTPTDSLTYSDDDPIRLCCNENPYGPSPLARQAIIDSMAQGCRYPRPSHQALKDKIAEQRGLSAEHVLLGSGSAQILQLIGLWLGMQKKSILSADDTFTWMMRYADRLGSQYRRQPMDEQGRFDLSALKSAIDEQVGLIYLCNPNNPTGTYLEAEQIAAFCRSIRPDMPILVDEAYIEYTPNGRSDSADRLIGAHPNVMVCRTFSKIYGMAGLRVGYLLADPKRIRELEKLECGMGMNLSNTSLEAARASLEDQAFLQNSREQTRKTRQFLQQQLRQWQVPCYDGAANFLYCRLPDTQSDWAIAFEKENIGLRPRQKDGRYYLRITIGTQQEMETFAHRMAPYFKNN